LCNRAASGAPISIHPRRPASRFHHRLAGRDVPFRGGSQTRIQVAGTIDHQAQLDGTASIEEPEVIAKILAHLERTASDQFQPELPLGARAPPVPSQASLL
jgi:hypothetical protein